jgi:hypothetical protein
MNKRETQKMMHVRSGIRYLITVPANVATSERCLELQEWLRFQGMRAIVVPDTLKVQEIAKRKPKIKLLNQQGKGTK